jgi:hypothetical protein
MRRNAASTAGSSGALIELAGIEPAPQVLIDKRECGGSI